MRHVDDLLARAFPYGALVMLENAGSFLSLRYEVNRVLPEGAVELWFERDHGATVQTVPIAALEQAALTGRLDLPVGRVRRPEAADCTLLAQPFATFIGPQTSGPSPDKDRFRARMRLHQSWWRTFRLRVPFGNGPGRTSLNPFGNMLRPEHGRAGLNFVSPEAWTAYLGAVAGNPKHVDSWRAGHNLLTGQAMCINVFGHLRHHPVLAAAFFTEVLGERGASGVEELRIEYTSDAISDQTSFDAYVRRSGAGDVAIETKLTEPFSQKAYDWQWYLRTCAAATGRWTTDDPDALGDLRWSQLWRNHLLAIAEHLRTDGHRCGNRGRGCRDPQVGGGPGWPRLMVVHHPLDERCVDAVDGYRALLVDPGEVVRVDLQQVVDTLRRLIGNDTAAHRWVDRLEERYLRFDLSEPLVDLPTW